MDIEHYVSRVEQHSGNPAALAQVRRDIDADTSLSELDREFLTGRVGTYLADADRERDAGSERSPEEAPDEEGEG